MEVFVTFKELSNLGKIKAVYDYLKGWLESHPEETFLDYKEIEEILLEGNAKYNKYGTYLTEFEE